MAELAVRSATIRITNQEGRAVCSVRNVSAIVDAERAAGFADAIQTLYNNGPCTAGMNVTYDIIS